MLNYWMITKSRTVLASKVLKSLLSMKILPNFTVSYSLSGSLASVETCSGWANWIEISIDCSVRFVSCICWIKIWSSSFTDEITFASSMSSIPNQSLLVLAYKISSFLAWSFADDLYRIGGSIMGLLNNIKSRPTGLSWTDSIYNSWSSSIYSASCLRS